ncbi:MAG: GFA family protein [Myxococcota bacterium]
MHRGSCHCGAVRFEVDMELDGLATCNCSICGRTGVIMSFVPEDKFRCLSGEDKLTDYQFGKKSVHHTFCSVCGVRPFGHGVGPDGTKMVMVNARCLDEVDTHTLTIGKQYDGKSW